MKINQAKETIGEESVLTAKGKIRMEKPGHIIRQIKDGTLTNDQVTAKDFILTPKDKDKEQYVNFSIRNESGKVVYVNFYESDVKKDQECSLLELAEFFHSISRQPQVACKLVNYKLIETKITEMEIL